MAAAAPAPTLVIVTSSPSHSMDLALDAPTDLAVYLTDGRMLFRVVTPLYQDGSVRARLEDCLTLAVEEYSPEELWSMHLERVSLETGD